MDKQVEMLNDIAQGTALSDPMRGQGKLMPRNRRIKLMPVTSIKYGKPSKKATTTRPQNLTIKMKEGTLAHRQNNPGNLRFAGQPDATRGERGFAKFKTPLAGFEALKRQIALDQSRNHTLESFVNKYAPPHENDTRNYVKHLEDQLGIPRHSSLKSKSPEAIAEAVMFIESNATIQR